MFYEQVKISQLDQNWNHNLYRKKRLKRKIIKVRLKNRFQRKRPQRLKGMKKRWIIMNTLGKT